MNLKKFFNNNIFNIILCIFFSIGITNYLFNDNQIVKQTIICLVTLISSNIVIRKNNSIDFKNKIIPFIFSVVFSLSLLIGKAIYTTNHISILYMNFKNVLLFFVALIGFSKFFTDFFYIIFDKISKINPRSNKQFEFFKKKYFFFILWFIIILSFIPAFLAYYPGILSYDSYHQTIQAIEGIKSYTKYHPPMHTFIWQFCFYLNNFIKIEPIIIYEIIQMIFLSFVYTKIITFIIKQNYNNIFIICSIAFFTVNPVISLFSLTMTKDTYFLGFFSLFILQLISLIKNSENFFSKKHNSILYIMFLLLSILFRNNMIYVYIVFIPIFNMIFKEYKKNILIINIITIVLYILINNVFFNIIGIQSGNPREFLSVPIQQLSLAINNHEEEIDKDIKEKINNYISYDIITQNYNPRFADPIKNNFHSDYLKNNKTDFLKIWFKLLLKYPDDYISAFLTLNIPYWYIDANTNDPYSQRRYIETNIWDTPYYTFERESKFPLALEQYEKVAYYTAFENSIILNIVFSISTPIWLVLFTTFALLFKKQYKFILCLIPIILLWLTYILGPVSNFRYISVIFVLYPIIIYLLFNNNSNLNET